MSTTQPLIRIEYAERVFEEYKGYVDGWKRHHDALAALLGNGGHPVESELRSRM